jgi:hypothetical protein
MRSLLIRSLSMKRLKAQSSTMPRRRAFPAACSAEAIASFAAISASSTGPVRQIAGLGLIGAFACAGWSLRRGRFDAMVPALGLTLTFLILAGLALAAVHALGAVPVALALLLFTLAAAWAGAHSPAAKPAGDGAPRQRLNPIAAAGFLIFAVAAVLAVRYSAASATADADRASSVALWAYPSGGQLHVGVAQPAGHGSASLRIVVAQAGATIAMWNDVRLAPGQTWQAPALSGAGNAPATVTVFHGGTVVASLSSR